MKIFEMMRVFSLNGVEVPKRDAKCDISRQTLAPDLNNKILCQYDDSSLTVGFIVVSLTVK